MVTTIVLLGTRFGILAYRLETFRVVKLAAVICVRGPSGLVTPCIIEDKLKSKLCLHRVFPRSLVYRLAAPVQALINRIRLLLWLASPRQLTARRLTQNTVVAVLHLGVTPETAVWLLRASVEVFLLKNLS